MKRPRPHRLPRDNIEVGEHWLLIDNHTVHIAKQRPGERATEAMAIPASVFRQMARWYVLGIVPRGIKKARPEGE